jgi:hypothetical protein
MVETVALRLFSVTSFVLTRPERVPRSVIVVPRRPEIELMSERFVEIAVQCVVLTLYRLDDKVAMSDPPSVFTRDERSSKRIEMAVRLAVVETERADSMPERLHRFADVFAADTNTLETRVLISLMDVWFTTMAAQCVVDTVASACEVWYAYVLRVSTRPEISDADKLTIARLLIVVFKAPDILTCTVALRAWKDRHKLLTTVLRPSTRLEIWFTDVFRVVMDPPRLPETVASVWDVWSAYVLSESIRVDICVAERLTFEIAFHCV